MTQTTTTAQRPLVGIGVFVLNELGEFLLGLRKGSHGAGTWALPGGHLEFGESFEECAAREVLEETGLDLDAQKIRFVDCSNNVIRDGSSAKHYVTILMLGKAAAGAVPQNSEPDKCEQWLWMSWKQVQQWTNEQKHESPASNRLFAPLFTFFDKHKMAPW